LKIENEEVVARYEDERSSPDDADPSYAIADKELLFTIDNRRVDTVLY
jgi:hypothetical protein